MNIRLNNACKIDIEKQSSNSNHPDSMKTLKVQIFQRKKKHRNEVYETTPTDKLRCLMELLQNNNGNFERINETNADAGGGNDEKQLTAHNIKAFLSHCACSRLG